jgi:phosphomannomutase/phosphoglucomutase
MASLFGTSGIRAHAEDVLTNQFCFDMGRAFGKFLAAHGQKGKIAMGTDTRVSGPRIKKAFSLGLIEENYEVVDQGTVPVPAINYILLSNPKFIGGCMITGSHIRGDHNGMKFYALKGEILKDHEREIEEMYEKTKGEVTFEKKDVEIKGDEEARGAYTAMLIDLANKPYPKWNIVLDLGNGCQANIMPDVFKILGLSPVIINNDLDPKNFLARDTETEGTVSQLQQRVKSEKADFGLAYDGDGDRVVFVDEDGGFIPGDYTGSLIGKYNAGDTVVTPVNTSQVVEHIGKNVIRTKVGSPYVVAAMKKHNATFGFEANGGGISSDVMLTRDGGSTTIKILNLLKETGKGLRDLVNELPKCYLYRTKVECPRELNTTIIKEAKEKFRGARTEEVDGVKIWIDDSSWILFRPSSNAPEFRVFAEAKTEADAKKLGEEGIEFVKSFID